MKSAVLPSFWKTYDPLNASIKRRAKKPICSGWTIPFIHHYISNVSTAKKVSGQQGSRWDIAPWGLWTATPSHGFGLANMTTMKNSSPKKTSTKRLQHYRKICRQFEIRYSITSDEFMLKFESGELGDSQNYFDWYAAKRGLENSSK